MATVTDIDCVKEKVPLADRTWFKLGGPAQFFAEPQSRRRAAGGRRALPR